MPPAIITSACPAMMALAAVAMVCRPEEQNRFTVWPGISTPGIALDITIFARFMPCSASGKAQPTITSSICRASNCGTCFSTPESTCAPISSGRERRNTPLGALPMAERPRATITASFISRTPLIPERFAGGQDGPDPLQRLLGHDQLSIALGFQIQQLSLTRVPLGTSPPVTTLARAESTSTS